MTDKRVLDAGCGDGQYAGKLAARGASVTAVIDAFKEPMPSEDLVARHPEWQHHRRIPSFIVMRARLLQTPRHFQ